MASKSAIAARHGVVRERLGKAMERLSKQAGVPLPPPLSVPYRQPELKAAAELERTADFLEAMLGDKPAEEEADEGDEPTFHGYPLGEFDGKSDEDILAYKGLGPATLEKIRAAQKERDGSA